MNSVEPCQTVLVELYSQNNNCRNMWVKDNYFGLVAGATIRISRQYFHVRVYCTCFFIVLFENCVYLYMKKKKKH